MATTFKGRFSLGISTEYRKDGGVVANKGDIETTYSWAFTSGAGADQCDLQFHDQRTLSTGANEDLDLAGALADAFGDTLTFARIKGIVVIAAAGNTTDLTLTAKATNGVSGLFAALGDGVVIGPDGAFIWITPDASGVAITASTADLLNMANAAGASATYDIIIIGAAS